MKKLLKSRKRYCIVGLVTTIILVAEILIINLTNKTYAAVLPEKFDLRSEIDIVVKNQHSNSVCPYMSKSSMVETHVKLGQKNGKYEFFKETPIFSALTYKWAGMYVPISVDRTEKIIQELYGNTMSNEDDILKIKGEYNDKDLTAKLSELEPSIDFAINEETNSLNALVEKSYKGILKEYTDNRIAYKDKKGNNLSEEQVKQQRAEYKNHIMKNGGLRCSIQTNGFRNGVNGGTVCLNKTITTASGNNSVLIIGWDDTYSKDNFPEDNRPSTDGAYLALNSLGADWGDNGTFYVSYEDIYIEQDITGVEGITEYKDTTSPVILAKVNENNKITITATDKYSSGIKQDSVKYLWTDHNIKPELTDANWISVKSGEEIENFEDKYLWLYGEDNAGNLYFNCEESNPSGIIIQGAENNCNSWSNKDVVVTISDAWSILDRASSFEMVATSSSISMEDLKKMEVIKDNFDHILTINKDGKHTINISRITNQREDMAEKIVVWIDKTSPTDAVINVNGNKDGEKYYKGATVEIKGGEDTVSGVKEVKIELKDKNGKDVTVRDKSKFCLSNEGTYTIKVITIDNAGNNSEVIKTVEVLDKEKISGEDDRKDEDKAVNPEEDEKKDEEKPVNSEEDERKDEEKPVNPEEDEKKDEEKQANSEENEKKDEDKPVDSEEDENKLVNPGEDEKKDENKPVNPGEDENKDENKPVNIGEDEKKDESKLVNPEDDEKKDEDKEANPGEDDKKDEDKEANLGEDDKKDEDKSVKLGEDDKKDQNYINTKVETKSDRLEIDTKSNETKNKNDTISNGVGARNNRSTIDKSEQIQTQYGNKANKILPATGSDAEIKLIIAIIGIIFIALVVHTYRKVKNNI